MRSVDVAVVIASFNERRDWLRTFLQSLEAQSSLPSEVIFCLPEGCRNRETLLEYGGSSPFRRFLVLESPVANVHSQHNISFHEVRAKYLTLVGSHDFLTPGKTELEYGLAEEHNLEIVYGPHLFCDEALNIIGLAEAVPFSVRRLIGQNVIPDFATTRTDLFQRHGGLDEAVGYAALYDLWLKAACERPNGIRGHDCPIYLYRTHGGQQSQTAALSQRELDNRALVVKRAFERLGIPYPKEATGFRVRDQEAYGLG